MTRSLPQRTSLNLDDPHVLLTQLTDDVDPAELLQVDSTMVAGTPRSVHSWAVYNLLWSSGSGQAMGWFKVCNRLIELKAPLTEPYHGDGVGPQLWATPWPDGNRHIALTLELVERYIAEGLFDIHRRMPGNVMPRPEPGSHADLSTAGLAPLACAILSEHPTLSQFFIRKGAALDLGEVFAGEPPFDAISLALACGDQATAAVAAEALMLRHLAGPAADADLASSAAAHPDPSAAPRLDSSVPTRRRASL